MPEAQVGNSNVKVNSEYSVLFWEDRYFIAESLHKCISIYLPNFGAFAKTEVVEMEVVEIRNPHDKTLHWGWKLTVREPMEGANPKTRVRYFMVARVSPRNVPTRAFRNWTRRRKYVKRASRGAVVT